MTDKKEEEGGALRWDRTPLRWQRVLVKEFESVQCEGLNRRET